MMRSCKLNNYGRVNVIRKIISPLRVRLFFQIESYNNVIPSGFKIEENRLNELRNVCINLKNIIKILEPINHEGVRLL